MTNWGSVLRDFTCANQSIPADQFDRRPGHPQIGPRRYATGRQPSARFAPTTVRNGLEQVSELIGIRIGSPAF